MIAESKNEKHKKVNDIIRQLKNEVTYEGTLSYAIVVKKERKHTYVVEIKHYRSRLAYGYDSDMYNQRKKSEIRKAKESFEEKLEKEGFDYKMIGLNTYKVKKKKNERFC